MNAACWGILVILGFLVLVLFLSALAGLWSQGKENQDRAQALDEARRYWHNRENEVKAYGSILWPSGVFHGSYCFSFEEVFGAEPDPNFDKPGFVADTTAALERPG